jgi:hypothetical protein
LERTARETVLRNISQRLRGGKNKLLQAIRRFKQDYAGEHSIVRFVDLMEVPLHMVYDHSLMWFDLLDESEGVMVSQDPFRKKLVKAMGSTWLSTDSTSYFMFLKAALSQGFAHREDVSAQQWCLMFYIDIFDEAPGVADHRVLVGRLDDLFKDDRIKFELIEYLSLRISSHDAIELNHTFPFSTALNLHGRYTRTQIIVGLGKSQLNRVFPSREGVLYVESINTEAFFVTLDKSGMDFNPSTMYNDYFINSSLFHWQSQNATSPLSPKGQSYIHHQEIKKNILLFVREANRNEDDLTMGFIFCGQIQYVSHEGSKPMSITWRMDVPPPAMLLDEGQKLAIG